ncbi:hypothetical protein HGRIS_008299 [Hohenbuehelia grisea]|uniref:Uncharacterized protein n=1 Tax=Hohenbuehelia grisea TaxID=104357 RepID=A0ABR3J7I8_9AGAR
MQTNSSPASTVTIRPKAKVNSSATPSRKAMSVVSTSAKSSSSSVRVTSSKPSTPRAVSPFKPMTAQVASQSSSSRSSPTHQPKVRATVRTTRPHTAHSELEVPGPRRRSITNVASDAGPLNRERTRHGSISLHHASSLAVLHRSQPPSRSPSPTYRRAPSPSSKTDIGLSSAGAPKVRAKVSNLAKQFNEQPPVPPLPISPSSLRTTRARAPSISNLPSPSSSSPSSTFYPITTASPAANPHRFAPSRPSPPPIHKQQFQAFRTLDDGYALSPKPLGLGIMAKIDPALVPLPPNSPPISAVSISSRSSISRSSVSYSADSALSLPGPSTNGSTAYDASSLNLPLGDDHDVTGDGGSPSDSSQLGQDEDSDAYPHDHHIKATAKTNRKIEDLKITNRSLLAINASLESAKHRQAKELRELRRKLRESRLILPPRTYRAVKSSLEPGEEDEEDDDDDDDDDEGVDPGSGDAAYNRVKSLIEDLLESGKRALESKPDPFEGSGKNVAKVLSPDEQQSWRDGAGDNSDFDIHPVEDQSDADHPDSSILSPSSVTVTQSVSNFDSEEEVEAMTLPSSPPSPSLPPILITESP